MRFTIVSLYIPIQRLRKVLLLVKHISFGILPRDLVAPDLAGCCREDESEQEDLAYRTMSKNLQRRKTVAANSPAQPP